MSEEEIKKIDDLTEAKYFQFVIEEKFGSFLKGKYLKYKNYLYSFGIVSLSAISFLGYDAYQTREILKERNNEIRALEKSIALLDSTVQVKEQEFNALLDDYQIRFSDTEGEFKSTLTKLELQKKFIEKQTDFAFNQIGSINSTLGVTMDNQQDYFDLILERTGKLHQNMEGMLVDAQHKLEMLDTTTFFSTMNELQARVESAEKSKTKWYTIKQDAQEKVIQTDRNKFVFRVISVGDASCGIKIDAQDYNLIVGEPVKIGAFGDTIELMSTSNKLLSAGKNKYVVIRVNEST